MDITPTRLHLTPGRPSHHPLGPPSPAPFDPATINKYSVHTLVFRSLKRSHDLFLHDQSDPPPDDSEADKINRAIRSHDQYGPVLDLVNPTESRIKSREDKRESPMSKSLVLGPSLPSPSQALVTTNQNKTPSKIPPVGNKDTSIVLSSGGVIIPRKPSIMPKPDWHPPWKLMRVISGHIGWVRCLAMEPGNEWFASGANDRLIKIWDLARGTLKISLTGHISPVRGLAISARQPYLFSCGEDKTVKCWDLEYNKVIRHYHGHLSGVYCISLHPLIDILVTGGRDSVARVWDMRTKAQIHALSGHSSTIASVQCQESEPQVITGSHDNTIRLWDLVAGKTRTTLTHHKKSVRALEFHPKLKMFVSGAPDNIKQWMCPEGKFVQNLSGHNSIVNCLAVNEDNVLVSGGDEGSLYFWDWKTGYNFQRTQAPPQPGSLDSERGIYDMIFDKSGSRLITGEADKTIKIYKIDDEATEETHPINWKPEIIKRRRY